MKLYKLTQLEFIPNFYTVHFAPYTSMLSVNVLVQKLLLNAGEIDPKWKRIVKIVFLSSKQKVIMDDFMTSTWN